MNKIFNQISISFRTSAIILTCIIVLTYGCSFLVYETGSSYRLKVTACQVDASFSSECEKARNADEIIQNIVNFLKETSKASLYSSILLLSLSVGFMRSKIDDDKS